MGKLILMAVFIIVCGVGVTVSWFRRDAQAGGVVETNAEREPVVVAGNKCAAKSAYEAKRCLSKAEIVRLLNEGYRETPRTELSGERYAATNENIVVRDGK